MTRDKVKIALECCINGVNCPECPYYEHDNCSDTMIADACYFMNNSEETDLQNELKVLQNELRIATDKYTKAEIEKEQLQMKLDELEKEMQYLKGKVEAYEFCWGNDI